MKYNPGPERREKAKQTLFSAHALTLRQLLAIASALETAPIALSWYPAPSCTVVENCTMFALRRSGICDEVRDVVESYRVFSHAYRGSSGFRDIDELLGSDHSNRIETSPDYLRPHRIARLEAFEQFLRDTAEAESN